MAGGTNQWPPEGGGGSQYRQPGFASGGPDDPAMGGSGYYGGGQGGGWGSSYGFKPKGPTQWAGPNAHYPNWNDDPSSGYANDVAMINAGPWPGGGGGMGGGWGSPWTGGGGGFGPGLIGWHVADGPGSGMGGHRPLVRTADFQDSNNNGVDDRDEEGYSYTRPGDEGYVGVEEGGGDVAASPFNWGSVGAGRLAKAKEYAALGQMGRAKDVFTSGVKGGAWSPEIHQQLRTFKTGG